MHFTLKKSLHLVSIIDFCSFRVFIVLLFSPNESLNPLHVKVKQILDVNLTNSYGNFFFFNSVVAILKFKMEALNVNCKPGTHCFRNQ